MVELDPNILASYISASAHIDGLSNAKAKLRHNGDYVQLKNPFTNLTATFYIYGKEQYRKRGETTKGEFEVYKDKTVELGPGQAKKVTLHEGKEKKWGRDLFWNRDIDVYLNGHTDNDTDVFTNVKEPPAINPDLGEDGFGGWIWLVVIAVIVLIIIIFMMKR